MENLELVHKAIMFATAVHSGIKRKYNGRDYIMHPFRVGMKLLLLNFQAEVVAAGILHDVIEESEDRTVPVTVEHLQEIFGDHVASMVKWLSNPPNDDSPRGLRKKRDRDRLRQAPCHVRIIKAIDRLDNLNEMDGAPDSFKLLYSEESLQLADALAEGNDFGGQLATLLVMLRLKAKNLRKEVNSEAEVEAGSSRRGDQGATEGSDDG